MLPLRRAMRSLWRSRGLSALIITALALGIGASTAVFSAADRLLLRPFPFPGLDRLVELNTADRSGDKRGVPPAAFAAIQARAHTLQQAATWRWQSYMLTGVDDPQQVTGGEMGAGWLQLLGVRPLLGRDFTARDYNAAAPGTVLLSYGAWQRFWAGDPHILGRQILLDGRGYTVIGVMRAGFVFPRAEFVLWTPMQTTVTAAGELGRDFNVIARLAPGATLDGARREAGAIFASVRGELHVDRDVRIEVRPFAERYTKPYRQSLPLLAAAALLVLLIACANAGSLMLARAAARAREFAVYLAMGAARWRLMAEIVIESLLLAAAASACGLFAAWAALRALAAAFPANVPRTAGVLDARVFAAAAALAFAAALLCAAPACWMLCRQNIAAELAASSRTAAGSAAGNRTRAVLLGVEAAIGIVLLAGAGVMLRSLNRLLDVQLGFEPQHVLTARVPAPAGLREKDAVSRYYARILDSATSLPGVRGAGVATLLPFGGVLGTTSFGAEACAADPVASKLPVELHSATPGYLGALGMRLIAGRDFMWSDNASAPGVAIIDDALARFCWPHESALGRHVSRNTHPTNPKEWLTVIGVVRGVRSQALDKAASPQIYQPLAQDNTGLRFATLVVRAQGDPAQLARALTRRILRVNPEQAVADVKRMQDWVLASASAPRFHTALIELFAAFALLLTTAGIFAAVKYMVIQRRRELAIRGALGAGRTNLMAFVLRRGLAPVVAGTAAGLILASWMTRLLRAELYQTAPADPLALTAAALVMLGAAACAAFIPAYRAGSVDAAALLRAE